MARAQSPLEAMRWLSAHNVSSREIPAFGLVRVTGVDSRGVLEVRRPNADGQDVLVNGPAPIAADGYGRVTPDSPVVVGYGGATPANGHTHWGAKAKTETARLGYRGFYVYGDLGDNRLLGRRQLRPLRAVVEGGGTGTVAPGGNATVAFTSASCDSGRFWDDDDPELIQFDRGNCGTYLIAGTMTVVIDYADGATALANDILAGDTGITVTGGVTFPTHSFNAKLGDEVVTVTSTGTGLNWTIGRGKEGTSAADWPAGTSLTYMMPSRGLVTLKLQPLGVTVANFHVSRDSGGVTDTNYGNDFLFGYGSSFQHAGTFDDGDDVYLEAFHGGSESGEFYFQLGIDLYIEELVGAPVNDPDPSGDSDLSMADIYGRASYGITEQLIHSSSGSASMPQILGVGASLGHSGSGLAGDGGGADL